MNPIEIVTIPSIMKMSRHEPSGMPPKPRTFRIPDAKRPPNAPARGAITTSDRIAFSTNKDSTNERSVKSHGCVLS